MDVSDNWRGAEFVNQFEETLLCPICKQICQVPSITECSHTFCGVCIRRHIDHEETCPTCRKEIQKARIRVNKFAEDVCNQYLWFREILKNKLYSSVPVNNAATQEGYEECPFCSKVLNVEELQSHAVQCMDEHESRLKRRKVMTTPKKIPAENYHAMSDTKLRKALQDYGLSKSGNRNRLIARHKEWTHHYNTNAESNQPRSIYELRRIIDEWDRTQDRQVKGSSQVALKDLDSANYECNHKDEFEELTQLARESMRKKNNGAERLSGPESSTGESNDVKAVKSSEEIIDLTREPSKASDKAD